MTSKLKIAHRRVRVRIPATTSNLGPGFDVLGLALKLYNEVDLEVLTNRGLDLVEIEGEGQDSLSRGPTNMVLQAVRKILPRGKFPHALRLRLTNRIPIARGLGSSAAARLGGILAAHALLPKTSTLTLPSPFQGEGENKKPSPLGGEGRVRGNELLLEAACRLEGHPDNVVAAFHGGLCIAVEADGRTMTIPVKVPRELGAVVCVPDFELSTEKARKVLPKLILRHDAVATAGRTALLIDAIERKNFGRLKFAMQDVVHQPYRAKLIPAMAQVIEAAVRAGAYGAALSGAGPSIFAFCPRGLRGAAIGRAMQKAFARKGVQSRSMVLDIELRGAVVEILR